MKHDKKARGGAAKDAKANPTSGQSAEQDATAEAQDQAQAISPEVADALNELKSRLTTATEFNEIIHYFFDVVEKLPGFIDLGSSSKNPKLIQILKEIFNRWTKGKMSVLTVNLIEIPEHRFVHGQCFISGYMGVVICFQDIGFGLLAVTPLGRRGPAEFVRFRHVDLPSDPRVPGGVAFVNPPGGANAA